MNTRRQLSLFLVFAVFVANSTAQAGFFDFFEELGEGIAKAVKKIGETVAKTAKKVGEGIVKSANGIAKGFENFGKGLVKGQLGAAFSDLGSGVGDIGTLLMEFNPLIGVARTVDSALEAAGVRGSPVGKVVEGMKAGVQAIGTMVGQAAGNTVELAGKTVATMVKDPLQALNPIEHYKALGMATYEFGKRYFYENQVAMVKDFIEVGKAFGQGQVGSALMGILDSVENIATRNIQALGKGVGTFVGEKVGNKKLGEEIAKQLTTNIQIGVGFVQFVAPVPLFGAGDNDPMLIVIGEVIGGFTDTEDLDVLTVDAAGCPIDQASQMIRANIGRGTKTFTVEQLLCNIDQKILKRFSVAYWKAFVDRGRYLVFKEETPKGFFLMMEDAEGYYNLQPDPVESGGVGASEIYYDPADGAMLIVLTDGRELEGALGSIKSMYCFGNSSGVLEGDPQCNKSVKTYVVPLEPGGTGDTAEASLADVLGAAVTPAMPIAPSAVTVGTPSSPVATGLAGALGGALEAAVSAAPATNKDVAPVPQPAGAEAGLAGALAGAATGDVPAGSAVEPEAEPVQSATIDVQDSLAGALGAALVGGAS